MRDLFGVEITEDEARKKLKRKGPTANGYAWKPGTGPKGETCKSCRHYIRNYQARVYLKCGLMRSKWTGSIKTDILAKAPACKFWEKPDASQSSS